MLQLTSLPWSGMPGHPGGETARDDDGNPSWNWSLQHARNTTTNVKEVLTHQCTKYIDAVRWATLICLLTSFELVWLLRCIKRRPVSVSEHEDMKSYRTSGSKLYLFITRYYREICRPPHAMTGLSRGTKPYKVRDGGRWGRTRRDLGTVLESKISVPAENWNLVIQPTVKWISEPIIFIYGSDLRMFHCVPEISKALFHFLNNRIRKRT
jgi:hypothetical protein